LDRAREWDLTLGSIDAVIGCGCLFNWSPDMSRSILIRLLTSLTLAWACSVSVADTLLVPGEYPTIQAAVDAASDGDEVLVSAGTYDSVQVFKQLTITGVEGADVTIIEGSSASTSNSAVHVASQLVTLRGLTIQNPAGSGTTGFGNVLNLVVEDCVYRNNELGISASIGSLTVSNTSFVNNERGIWLFFSGAGLTSITGCSFEGNSSGAVILDGSRAAAISDCVFMNNSTAGNGGAILLDGPPATIDGCSFEMNSAEGSGGAMDLYGPDVQVMNSTFTGNTAPNGSGGAVRLLNGASISSSELTGNLAMRGGAILIDTDSTIHDCQINNNSATGDGGGVWTNQAMVITNSSFSDNTSGGNGGGAWLGGMSSEIRDTTFSRNEAIGTGGGVHVNEHNSTITRCDMDENQAGTEGGGIFVKSPGVVVYTDSVLCNNTPDEFNYTGGYLVTNVTTCTGSCQADLNGDGVLNFFDVSSFLSIYGAGCP
jgi:Right handed beta helix region